ncbi:tRNA (adenosine(37)-N6)-threonylcarbamoyltransferase complex dimerization subunit type 1 TsaB [Peribacillus kribbensis]|uniref:tRNA (adenosine(37)-N6)-threonylcarbamoyltransferase complex dimerization subunit type 1 TsaB n=1 Tax=Peribacillus kribbensis TaxID=356658 RepID=UPI00041DD63C|nr:tRNA (adenosine(37)-N6)-threonylcarbamoyltransferase complex dimerization subunit type 1 TsaB [Peribacillus kribbensis]
MKVLAIDTSNYVMGIALLEDGKVSGEYITNLQKNHSVRVMPAIQDLMRECNVKPAELDKVVVAKGPGSYTGVRIGVTIAKTLAWTLNIPLSGISSLEVLAANGKHFNGLISPLFDARRGQIYTGLYGYNEGLLQTVKDDRNVLASDWAEELKQREEEILFLGTDLPIHESVIKEIMGEKAKFAPYTSFNPRPGELAFLGIHKEAEDIHTFVPNYIRLAEAEAKWREQQNLK